jgi:sec-independent protein translocase protein TatA
MGNTGFGELLVIFLVLILVFGSSKLPQLGDALGKSIRNFKKASSGDDAIDVTPKRDSLPQAQQQAPSAVENKPITPK